MGLKMGEWCFFMGNSPIPLRGHHLSRIGLVNLGRRNYGELMMRTGYSEHSLDSFASETYDFLRCLIDNPDQKVLVVAGESDFICQRCPERKRAGCSSYDIEAHPLYGTAFWDSSMRPGDVDERYAEEAGLEVGGIYSVKQIIEATREQADRFADSLEI